jgi:hypothetical protein
MKNKIIAIGTISVLVGVLLLNIAVLIYLLIWLGNDIWQIITNPSRLANIGREFLAMVGSLGVCGIGIVLMIVIIGRIPPKWWHGGLESNGDDDDDPYYRYM